MRELVIKKCLGCGAMVEVMQDCTCENCGIKCCGKEMEVIKPNTVDAAVEKHVPVYEVVEGSSIVVKVNHVMEEDHYIEWIAMASDEKIGKKFLKPGEDPTVTFPYIPGSKIYAYCNKHSLWSADVK